MVMRSSSSFSLSLSNYSHNYTTFLDLLFYCCCCYQLINVLNSSKLWYGQRRHCFSLNLSKPNCAVLCDNAQALCAMPTKEWTAFVTYHFGFTADSEPTFLFFLPQGAGLAQRSSYYSAWPKKSRTPLLSSLQMWTVLAMTSLDNGQDVSGLRCEIRCNAALPQLLNPFENPDKATGP